MYLHDHGLEGLCAECRAHAAGVEYGLHSRPAEIQRLAVAEAVSVERQRCAKVMRVAIMEISAGPAATMMADHVAARILSGE